MAGRMTLIKSSLDSIPNYWFSLHRIPKSIIEKMERIRRQFFWGEIGQGGIHVRKLHVVSWNQVCSSKEQGGLSLSKVGNRNVVLLSKWWWRFHKEQDKTWMQFILNKYGRDFIYKVKEDPQHMSLMFKEI